MTNLFTIGCDPELFWKDSNQLISVIGKLGGSKTNPKDIGNGCAVQEDNVAAEFCIPPSSNVGEFILGIEYSLKEIESRANELGLTLAQGVASGLFSKDQLNNRKAREFGCDPDFNAYTLQHNPRPRADNKQLRSAGGHVHIGTTKDPIKIVQTMDALLGVPSVLLDEDTERRKLYGKAGCYRTKPYGVEYRTLSNFWIWSKDTIKWVYHQTQRAVEDCDSFLDQITENETEMVIDCINNNNHESAKYLVNKWSIALP